MALHLTTGHLKPRHGWSRYRDANPVHTSPLIDNIATTPSGPVEMVSLLISLYPAHIMARGSTIVPLASPI